ncbi:MAG: hypothetical protein KAS72_02465 [Phycisphaerales bacterium]|nr:hypothetical protein [Phycisphaerales bacterium]
MRCRYSLKGLSIIGACPECGTPIGTTILFTVDPQAPQLRPMRHPRLMGAAVLLASLCGLLSALLLVTPSVADGLHELLGWFTEPSLRAIRRQMPSLAVIPLLITLVSCLVMYRPVVGTPMNCRVGVLGSIIGFLLVIASLLLLQWFDVQLGLRGAFHKVSPYDRPDEITRALVRIVFDIGLVTIFVLIRPSARLLVYRSLALRMGRVGRQALYPMAAAAGAAAIGDLLRYLALRMTSELDIGSSPLQLIGDITVWVSCSFIVLGLLRSVVDGWHIRRSLVAPSPSLDDLLAFRRS